MLPVEILPVQETIVLRARGSELLILPHHVKKLKGLEKPRDFSQYFRAEALVNRPARKLFEAWLRKDQTLWPRLYQTVHKEIEFAPDSDGDASAHDDGPKVAAGSVAKSAPSVPHVATSTTVDSAAQAKSDSSGDESKDKKSAKKTATVSDETKEAAPKSAKKPAKAKVAEEENKEEDAAPKKAVKKTAAKVAKSSEEEPAKKEKTSKKPSSKEAAGTKKKEPATSKSKAKPSAEDKPKKKKG